MDKLTKRFMNAVHKAQNIVISTHLHPDADGIGSEIALCVALRQFGKQVICVNDEFLLERYQYLDTDGVVISVEEYQKQFKEQKIDLFIVVDTNLLKRIGTGAAKLAETADDILFIDHHPCKDEVANEHCIDVEKSATGELVGRLMEALGVRFTPELALPLYTSILIDTSCFRYPTVTGDTHRLVGKLMDTGIQPPYAYNMIYGTKKVSHMQLLGTVLSNATTNNDGSVAWLQLSQEVINRFSVDIEDTHAFINHLLILDNVKVACMFREMKGKVKLSLRSTGNIDVGVIAKDLGGGGHNHSAATIIEGTLSEVVDNSVKRIEELLNKSS